MRGPAVRAHDRGMTTQHFAFNSLVEYLERRQQHRDDRRLARAAASTTRPTAPATAPAVVRPVRPQIRLVSVRHLVRGGAAAESAR